MSRRPCSCVLAWLLGAGLVAGCMGGGTEVEADAIAAGGLERPARAFGELRVAYGPELDYVDPALAFSPQSWSLLWHVYVPLLVYPHASGEAGARPVPGLAEDLPDVSADGLSYRFRLRDGLTYSDGQPIRAGDVGYAIERLLRMGSAGSELFAALEGAERVADGRAKRLAGVVTDDDERTVEFRLASPRPEFLQVLATPFAAPVPRGTPAVEQAERPIPASGAYAIASFRPGRRVVLVRNRRFRGLPGFAAGNPDRIVVTLRGGRTGADYGARRGTVRLSLRPATMFVFLNTSTPPFDRHAVRRAVALGLDRRELARAASVPVVSAARLIPPGIPGHEDVDPQVPRLQRARQLVERARLRSRAVTVWASSAPSARGPARKLVDNLWKIGLRPRLRQLPPGRYLASITGQGSRAKIGVVTWTAPIPHPALWLEPLLDGDRIEGLPNTNVAHVDEPALNDRLAELRALPWLTADAEAAWTAVDRLAEAHGAVVPFAHPLAVHRLGTRVDPSCFADHVVYGVDLTQLCLRRPAPDGSLERGN